MDPQDQRPKRPSLLVGDAEQAKPVESNNRILADIGGQKPSNKSKAKPSRPTSSPTGKQARWWVAALVIALLLALGIWRFAPDSGPAAPTPTHETLAATSAAPAATEPPPSATSASSTMTGNHVAGTGDGGAVSAGSSNGDSAVIVEDPQKPELASASPSAGAATTAANATSAELGRVFSAAPVPVPVPVKPAALQSRAKHDDDVDLLTALMRHLDDDTVASPLPSASSARHTAKSASKQQVSAAPRSSATASGGNPEKAEQRLKRCPAANTEAGVACRQRICAQFQGRTPSCPAPQPSAAAALGQE